MSLHELIRTSLAESFLTADELDGVRVTTHCMYPSNAFVQVIVRGGQDNFFVSDEGGALKEIESAGGEVRNEDKLLAHLVSSQGLVISGGVIRSPQVNAEALSVAIALVANASQDAAEWLFEHVKIPRQRNFKLIVHNFLRQKFNDHVQVGTVVGASNKPHKFENLLRLPNGKRLIIDPVIHDPSSINARVVANMDVRQMNYADLQQRIIYDDEEDWRPEDLNLLQVGAPVIAFSKAPEVISRLAAAA